jgi:hypothetical protein
MGLIYHGGFNIPWVEIKYTMGRGFNIPLVRGFNIPWVGVQYNMGRVFDIPWVGGSIYHG